MKTAIITILIILVIIAGCSDNDNPGQTNTSINSSNNTLSPEKLLLNSDELSQFQLTKNESECKTEDYPESDHSSQTQYGICFYNMKNDSTEIIIQISKYTNVETLNNAYQYDSSHYYSSQGLISENTYGDLSKFRLSNENDYGGQYNDPSVYVYHLWIVKDKYLIHITSKGKTDIKENIEQIARQILKKFN